jgi:hypothetical protein
VQSSAVRRQERVITQRWGLHSILSFKLCEIDVER